MTNLRTAAQQVLEAFRMCVPMDGRHAEVDAAFRNLRAALAEPVQRKEHCLWARNGNEPCPHVHSAEPVQEPVA